MRRPRRNVPRVSYYEGEAVPTKKKKPKLIRLERAPDPVMFRSAHDGQHGARLRKNAEYGDRVYFQVVKKPWETLSESEKVHLIDFEETPDGQPDLYVVAKGLAGLINVCGNNYLTNMTLHLDADPPYAQAERFIAKGQFGYTTYGKGTLKAMGIQFPYRLITTEINNVVEVKPILKAIAKNWFPVRGAMSLRVIAFITSVSVNVTVTELYEKYLKKGLLLKLARFRKSFLISFNAKWDYRMTKEFYNNQVGRCKAVMVVFYISLRNRRLEFSSSVATLETYLALRDRSWYETPYYLDQDYTISRKINVKENMVFKVLLCIKKRR